jgi:hypothetical protein
MLESRYVLLAQEKTQNVVGLLYLSEHGVYKRFDGSWEAVDPRVEQNQFDSLWMIEVSSSAITPFDSAERTQAGLSIADFADCAITADGTFIPRYPHYRDHSPELSSEAKPDPDPNSVLDANLPGAAR